MKLKRILCSALAISLLFIQTAMAAPAAEHSGTEKDYILYISGTADMGAGETHKYTANLIVKDNGSIIGIDQTEINTDGTYEFKLRTSSDPAECDISVRAGTEDVTLSITSSVAEKSDVEYIVGITDQSGKGTIGVNDTANVVLKIVNKYKAGDAAFKIYIASYDKNGRLLDVKSTAEANEVPYDINSSVEFVSDLKITEDTDKIKAYVWKDGSVIPVTITPAERTIDSNIYVDVNAEADGDGSKEKPFGGIDEAVAALRSVEGSKTPVSVILSEGAYEITDTALLSNIDTGAAVTFEAADGAEVEITGFTPISVSGNDKIKTADVSAINTDIEIERIDDFLGYPAILYCNGVKQSLSRWPNEGWNVMNSGDVTVEGGSLSAEGWNMSNADKKPRAVFSYQNSNGNPSNWTQTNNLYVVGNLGNEYTTEWVEMGSVDTSAKTITLGKYTKYGVVADDNYQARWAVVNSRDEIDIPGEWAIDDNTLYWYPSSDLTGSDDIKITGMSNTLVSIINCKNLVFENITFSGTRGKGIEINKSDNIRFNNCIIRDIGKAAFDISESTDVDIAGCQINNTEGMYIWKCGDYANLIPANINITNNSMYSNPIDTVSMITIEPANASIENRCVGVNFTNNTLSGVAIAVAGIDTKINNNEISNTMRNKSDNGSIYAGRSLTEYDNEINNNYIHDYGSLENNVPIAVNGIFLDDYQSGTIVKGNIIAANHKNKSGGIKFNGGSDNIIEDNVIINTGTPLILADWSSLETAQTADAFYAETAGKYLRDGIHMFSTEPWLSAHPGIGALKTRIDADGKYITKSNNVRNNLFSNCGSLSNTLTDGSNVVENNKTTSSPSYDLTNIGSDIKAGEVKLPTLLYPSNGATGVPIAECTLVCEEDMLAEEYYFEISTNENFTDGLWGLIKNTTRQTVFTPRFVFDGAKANTKYYWRVTARNNTNMGKSEKMSDVYTFTTAN